jgi:hypothetical protein
MNPVPNPHSAMPTGTLNFFVKQWIVAVIFPNYAFNKPDWLRIADGQFMRTK